MKEYSRLLNPWFLPDSHNISDAVLCRFDLNTAVNKKGFPEDSPKFTNCAETLKGYQNLFPSARWVILTHQGRRGNRECISTIMHAEILRKHGLDVEFCNEVPYGERVKREIQELQPQQVLILENTRFPPLWEWEKGLRGQFSIQVKHPVTDVLVEATDYYINDAYETAHRGDSSVTGLALRFHREEGKKTYLGKHLEHEVQKLERLKRKVRHSSSISLYAGGSKFKLKYHGDLMDQFPQLRLFSGGIPGQATAIAKGYSLNEKNDRFIKTHFKQDISKARNLINEFGEERIFHPLDWFLEDEKGRIHSVTLEEISEREGVIRDIGPKTVAEYTRDSSDINLLAGPPGMADEGFAFGTHGLLYGLHMAGNPLWVLGGHGATALPKGKELEQMKTRIEYMAAGGAALTHLIGKEMSLFDVLINQSHK